MNDFIFAHNRSEALKIMSEQTDEIDIVAVTIDSDDSDDSDDIGG